MAFFALNYEFDNWQAVQDMKKAYEENSKTVLVIIKCDKLKGVSDLSKQLIYERVTFSCKAGVERPTKSQGHRSSSTYKKNCPVQVGSKW